MLLLADCFCAASKSWHIQKQLMPRPKQLRIHTKVAASWRRTSHPRCTRKNAKNNRNKKQAFLLKVYEPRNLIWVALERQTNWVAVSMIWVHNPPMACRKRQADASKHSTAFNNYEAETGYTGVNRFKQIHVQLRENYNLKVYKFQKRNNYRYTTPEKNKSCTFIPPKQEIYIPFLKKAEQFLRVWIPKEPYALHSLMFIGKVSKFMIFFLSVLIFVQLKNLAIEPELLKSHGGHRPQPTLLTFLGWSNEPHWYKSTCARVPQAT